MSNRPSTAAATAAASSSPTGQEDLTLLPSLTEKSINDNLKVRFLRDVIYTNIGNVLLSVNPYRPIPFLYTDDMIEFYKHGGKERGVSNVMRFQRAVAESLLRMAETSGGGGSGSSSNTAAAARLSLNSHGRGAASASTATASSSSSSAALAPAMITALITGSSSSGSNKPAAAAAAAAVTTTSVVDVTRRLASTFACLSGGPHVFQLAHRMYHSLINEEQNQTVIISGESGAGKTEASKQIINFISYVSDQRMRGDSNSDSNNNDGGGGGGNGNQSATSSSSSPATAAANSSGVENTIEKIKSIIIESNPLMEAFGNAKTVKNDNSSRFGKFFEIYFLKHSGSGSSSSGGGGNTTNTSTSSSGRDDKDKKSRRDDYHGLPVGGHMSIFLLEKSRVVHQQYGERSFHIFYQLIAGLDATTKSRLRLDMFGGNSGNNINNSGGRLFFNYLSRGFTTTIDGVDDAAEFARTRHAMRVVGLSETAQGYVFETLAAILHTGEIEFSDPADDDDNDNTNSNHAITVGSQPCRVVNRDALDFVASLLQIGDPAALEKALTYKTLEIGERGGGATGRGASAIRVIEVPLDVGACRSNRDSVAKLLYDSLFNFIVYFVNHSLASASEFMTSLSSGGSGGNSSNNSGGGPPEDVLFRNYAANTRQSALAAQHAESTRRFLMLGVLDIYGFEIFANNSFEQLCINYINEKLHQIFIDLTLRKEQDEYAQEGIELPCRIEGLFDNKRILDVIEGTMGRGGGNSNQSSNGKSASPPPPPSSTTTTATTTAAGVPGIFELLDDICVSLAKESEEVADAKFLEKLDVFLSASPATAASFQKSERNGFFTIKHYAGSVMYNVNGFVAKNRDAVSNTVLEALRGSDNIFVTEILAPSLFLLDEEKGSGAAALAKAAAAGSGGRGGVPRHRRCNNTASLSAGRKIRLQAEQLVATLRSSTIHYIRTIKPNEEKAPRVFSDDCVLHQIQYLGLMENVQIRKMGFIYRGYFDSFLRRFHIVFLLLNERIRRGLYNPYTTNANSKNSSGGYVAPYNIVDHDDKESCRVLLTFVQDEVNGSNNSTNNTASSSSRLVFEPGCWQLGTTMAFVRQPSHLATLERVRLACVEAQVVRIQRSYRIFASQRVHTLLRQRMGRLYEEGGKRRRADSVFRTYTGDYLDIKHSDDGGSGGGGGGIGGNAHHNTTTTTTTSTTAGGGLFRYNATGNHRDLLRLLRYDPAAVGWREVYSERDGRFYYVNLFTGESQWAKPPAMADMEACGNYLDDNELNSSNNSGGSGQGPVNTEGVRVVFSAKTARVVLSPAPIRISSYGGGGGEAGATHSSSSINNSSNGVSTPAAAAAAPPPPAAWATCRVEECILILTTKAMFIFREVDDDHSNENTNSSGSSHAVLVKRIDLSLLRGVTVSPYADDCLYLHVYPQTAPCRPVFLSTANNNTTTDGVPADAAAAAHDHESRGVKDKDKRGGKSGSSSKDKKAAPAMTAGGGAVLCDCCGRSLTPSEPRAHCPCCGRLCCGSPDAGINSTIHDGDGVGGCLSQYRRPLPTVLGTNVVNAAALRAVAARKSAAAAAAAAARAEAIRAHMAAAAGGCGGNGDDNNRNSKKDKASKKGKDKAEQATTTTALKPEEQQTLYAAAVAAVDATAATTTSTPDHTILTEADLQCMESVAVCPFCPRLEPLEVAEDMCIKSFLRTELAAFLLRTYQQQTGMSLPFTAAQPMDTPPSPISNSGYGPAAPPVINLYVACNEQLQRLLALPSTVAAVAGVSVTARNGNNLLSAAVALMDAADGVHAADADDASTTATSKKKSREEKERGSGKQKGKKDATAVDNTKAIIVRQQQQALLRELLPPLPFSSYTTVPVECFERDGIATNTVDDGGDGSRVELIEGATTVFMEGHQQQQHQQQQQQQRLSVATLRVSAPPALPAAVIAAVAASRDARRAAAERRRRDEEVLLRSRAAEKERDREAAREVLMAARRRERQQQEYQEESARRWKEEEQRQRREAAARAIAERAKRGL